MSFLARALWAAERAIHAVGQTAAMVARAGRPGSVRLTQYQPLNQSKWSVEAILTALDQHEDGDFGESARLASAMGRDDRIAACRNTRVRALIGRNGATFQIKPSDEGDQRRAGAIADQIRKLWPQCITEDILARIQGDVVDIGVAIARIHWYRNEATKKQWLFWLEPWGMEFVRYNHFRKCYVAQTEQGWVDVLPNTGEWLIVSPSGERGWMAGAVRALGMPFYLRGMTWKDFARYCEKHGVPILAIQEPPNEVETTKGATGGTKEKFFAQLKRLGREGILRLPKNKDGKGGYDAKIVEPKTLSWPAFEAFLVRLETCIAIFLLGQNLSTEVKGGSFAAAVAQNRVRLDYLAADAEGLSTSLRNQVWAWWGRFNFDWWDDAITPWGVWGTEEPEDLKARAITFEKLSKAIATMKAAKVAFDERALCEQFGVPLLTVQEALKRAEEEATKAAEQEKQAPPAKDDATDKSTDDTEESE